MSYYTQVEFHFAGDPPPFDIVEACARAQFDPQRYGVEDLLSDLRRGWTDGKTEFNRLEPTDLIQLMCSVSAKFPDLSMCMRGTGEEWRDVWVREFLRGEVSFSGGPFFGQEKKAPFFRFFFK